MEKIFEPEATITVAPSWLEGALAEEAYEPDWEEGSDYDSGTSEDYPLGFV